MTILCDLAAKYGSDKCPQVKHGYTPWYYEQFKKNRHKIKTVIEIGVLEGASLRMWSEFFPHATIWGVDVDLTRYSQARSKRIRLFQGNQTNPEDLRRLIDWTGPDVDLVIDDGSHFWKDQVVACRTLMPLLDDDVLYCIEDAHRCATITQKLGQYRCETFAFQPRGRDNKLVTVRKGNAYAERDYPIVSRPAVRQDR